MASKRCDSEIIKPINRALDENKTAAAYERLEIEDQHILMLKLRIKPLTILN